MRTSAGIYCSFRAAALLYLLLAAACAGVAQKEEFDSVVTASWYGEDFHGKPTSSGDIFDMNAKTAAHRSLPFGTLVKVTNLENGRSTVVTINDRGPFNEERGIDLSYGAAREIGLVRNGTARVRLEAVGRDPSYIRSVGYDKYLKGPLTIQVASFAERDNADRLIRALSKTYRDVYVSAVYVGGNKFYRVRVGRFRATEEAAAVAERLAREGYSVLVTRHDQKI